MDTSIEKRVELHCHTKMSDMDGVSEVKDIIKRAKKWGMTSIAVTDHAVSRPFRMQTMRWIREIPLRSSTGSRDDL